MPLRQRNPGLYRKLLLCAARDIYWGIAVITTFPANLVPGGFPAWAVGSAFIAVGIGEGLGAVRTHTSDPLHRIFLIEQVPLICAAAMWGVSAVWSFWAWQHDLGPRTIGALGVYGFMCLDAFKEKAEPLVVK